MGARTKARFARAQRVASLFEDSFSLVPLTYWLSDLKKTNSGRYTQVVHLIGRLLGPGHYRFTEKVEQGDYLFERGGLNIPFRAMSDGYRAFLGWIGDLLFHICYGCPSGKKLVESSGIVLVDEIDLHLHPKWQMKVIATVAKALPRMQFVFTSHSPLVAGSLEWMNIIALKIKGKNATSARRLRQSIHGLDADQVLLTDFFELNTTRAKAKRTQLDQLKQKARSGDDEAAREHRTPSSASVSTSRTLTFWLALKATGRFWNGSPLPFVVPSGRYSSAANRCGQQPVGGDDLRAEGVTDFSDYASAQGRPRRSR
jgi:hypothetical protein